MHIISFEVPDDRKVYSSQKDYSFRTELCLAIIERAKLDPLPVRNFKLELAAFPEIDIANSWGTPEEVFFKCQAERARSYDRLVKECNPNDLVIVYDGYFNADREWRAAYTAISETQNKTRMGAFVKQRPYDQNGTMLASRIGFEYSLHLLCVKKPAEPHRYANRFGINPKTVHLCRRDLKFDLQVEQAYTRVKGLMTLPA